MLTKPYVIQSQVTSPVRGNDGRFQRLNATPPNPIEVEEAGRQPQQWAPGIGQNSDQIRSGNIPWPDAPRSGLGFKITGG